MIYHGKKAPGSLLTNSLVDSTSLRRQLADAAGGRQRPPTGSGQREGNNQDGQACVDDWQRDTKNAETPIDPG